MRMPSTVGLTAIACTQLPAAPCTLSWVCFYATLTAMASNAEGPFLAGPHPHPWTPSEGQDGTVVEAWAPETVRPDPSQGLIWLLSWLAPQA